MIPIRYRDKKPLVAWSKYRATLPNDHDLSMWSRLKINWAVVCGWQGLTVLDFDKRDAYSLWYTWATHQPGIARIVAERTYRVITSRGVHVYTYIQEAPGCAHLGLIDVKGAGGYVLIPPSVHPSGCSYTPLIDRAPILKVDTLAEIMPRNLAYPVCKAENLARGERDRSQTPTDPWDLADNQRPLRSTGSDLISAIKRQKGPLDLLPNAIKTDEEGRYWITYCPFHEDHSPSFWVDRQRGLCGCYAGCTGNKGLDVIDLYARLHSLSNNEAIRALGRTL